MIQLISYLFSLLMFTCIRSESQLNYKLSEGSKRKLEESKPNITSLPWNHQEFIMNFQIALLILNHSNFYQIYTYKSTYPKKLFGFIISETLKAKEYDADLVLFINIENSIFADYLAYCGPAIFDVQTLRPIFGLISWNMVYSNLDFMTSSLFENNVETAVHEIIHGLGFTEDFFTSYYDSFTGESYNTSNSYTVSNAIYLSTPRVTNFVQYHFNCTTLKGLQMENNGGQGTEGSHLERTLFYNEIMTGSDMIGNFLITDFTFQLLQDTGFYRIADYSPDQPLWGKNKGCEFANQQCKGGNFSEFCTEDQSDSCSFYKTGVSTCIQESLSGSCYYQYIHVDQDCRDPDNIEAWKSSQFIQHFGSDSLCISGSVSKEESYQKHSCIQYKCDLNNKLSLVIDEQEFDCSTAETIKLPESYYGNITCPSNPQEFCQNRDECPNLCSQKGFCMNKECICMLGYSSQDCSIECTNYRYKGSCLDKCPDSTYVNENIKYCVGCPANCLTCSNYNQCTECKLGYILRGAFCDNFKLIELLTVDISSLNSTSYNSTSNSTNTNNSNTTNTNTNSTNTSSNSTNTSSNSTDISTNSTETTTNSTETTTNSTQSTTNSTDISTNSTEATTNSTEAKFNSTDSTKTEDSNFNASNKEDLIYLINIFLLTYF